MNFQSKPVTIIASAMMREVVIKPVSLILNVLFASLCLDNFSENIGILLMSSPERITASTGIKYGLPTI